MNGNVDNLDPENYSVADDVTAEREIIMVGGRAVKEGEAGSFARSTSFASAQGLAPKGVATTENGKTGDFRKISDRLEVSQRPIPIGFALKGVYIECGRRVLCASRVIKSDRLQLKNVNLIFRPGKLTGILGSSGSGKSTLLNLLAGRLSSREIYQGELCLYTPNGQRYRSVKHFPGSVRYAMSTESFLFEMTLEEILLMTATLASCQGMRAPDDFAATRVVSRTVEDLALRAAARTIVAHLSTKTGASAGERKRLMLGKELCSDIGGLSCLLADEPSTGVDTLSALMIFKCLRTLVKTGDIGTCICTLHQPSPSVFSMLDEVVVLSGGHVVYSGPPSEMVATVGALSLQSSRVLCSPPDDLSPAESVFNMLPNEMIESSADIEIVSSSHSNAFMNCPLGHAIIERVDRVLSYPEGHISRGIRSSFRHFCNKWWHVWLLTGIVIKSMFRVNAVRFWLPLLFLVEGLCLGGLFHGSFDIAAYAVPPNLMDYSILNSTSVAEAFHTLAHETTSFDALLQKGVTGNITHADPLKSLITWPALYEWAHKTLHCAHDHYGMGLDQVPDGIDNNWTYPLNWYYQHHHNKTWINDVMTVEVPPIGERGWDAVKSSAKGLDAIPAAFEGLHHDRLSRPDLKVRNLPAAAVDSATEEASSTDEEVSWDGPMDSDIAFDENYYFVTPRGVVTEVITLAQILDLAVNKFNYTGPLADCEASRDSYFWYVCLIWNGFFDHLQKIVMCSGLPELSLLGTSLFHETKGNSVVALSSGGHRPMESVDVLEGLLSSATEVNRNRERGDEIVGVASERGQQQNEQHPASSGTTEKANTKSPLRQLFLIFDHNWPLFSYLKAFLTDWIPARFLYDLILTILDGVSAGMSQIACVFFLVAALGFSSLLQMFVFDRMKVVAVRDIANGHYSRSTFYLSFCLGMIPMDILQAFFCSLPFVIISGLDPSCWVQIVAVSILGTFGLAGIGLVVGTASPDLNAAIRIMPIALVWSILFSGYFVRDYTTPAWLRWLQYCSPYRSTFFAFSLLASPDGEWAGRVPNDFILGVNGIDVRNINYCIWLLVVQAVVLRLVGYLFFCCVGRGLHTR